jgi:hypothetical protein
VLGIGEDRLSVYLNDHLMGSTTGVRIARDVANRDASPVFDALAQEIAEDRQTLLDLMDRFGARADHVKVALGWVAERAFQLKFRGELRRYTPLSLLEEIETHLELRERDRLPGPVRRRHVFPVRRSARRLPRTRGRRIARVRVGRGRHRRSHRWAGSRLNWSLSMAAMLRSAAKYFETLSPLDVTDSGTVWRTSGRN